MIYRIIEYVQLRLMLGVMEQSTETNQQTRRVCGEGRLFMRDTGTLHVYRCTGTFCAYECYRDVMCRSVYYGDILCVCVCYGNILCACVIQGHIVCI